MPATVAVEVTLFIVCVWAYARATEARNTKGRMALWGLVGFLMVIYVGNIFGPPPPTGHAVAWTATSMWLLVAWGAWIDRNRSVRAPA